MSNFCWKKDKKKKEKKKKNKQLHTLLSDIITRFRQKFKGKKYTHFKRVFLNNAREPCSLKNNVRDINYFTKNFTNCWCGEWLLVNEKVILIVDLDENQ